MIEREIADESMARAPGATDPIEEKMRPISFEDTNALRDSELDALRAFHDFFLNRCEVLFFHFGMPAIDLYNAAFRIRRNNTSRELSDEA